MIWAFLSEWVSQNWWIIQHHVENPASFNKEVSRPVFLGLAPKNSNRREKDPNPTWCICFHTRKVITISHLLIFLATQSGNDCILSVLWAIFWYDQSNLQNFAPMNIRSTIIYPSKPFHYIHPSSIHDLLMLTAPLVQLNISAEAGKCHTVVNKLNAVFLPLDLPMISYRWYLTNDLFSHPDQPCVPAQHREDPGVQVASQLHPRGRPS